jgi:hypothetical protein
LYGGDTELRDGVTSFQVTFVPLPGTLTTLSGTPVASGDFTTEDTLVFVNTGITDTTAKIFYNARVDGGVATKNVEVRLGITACIGGTVDSCGICNGNNKNQDGCGVCYGKIKN